MKPRPARQPSPAIGARDPDTWERGCSADRVRNEVVIPHLASALRCSRPAAVLDLGSGSGYITRHLAGAPWAAGTHWTLVDVDEALLDYALASMMSGWSVTAVRYDLTGALPPAELQGDVAFAVFTLLEFRANPQLARNCTALLRPEGELLIYLPDVLADIHAASTDETTLASFLAGHCMLEKVDHFTGTPEAFHATRIEHLLNILLDAGLHLTALEVIPRTDRVEDIYCLRCRRVPATPLS